MDNGLEWNVKISQRELAHLWDATIAAFESHWEDSRTFEPCLLKKDLERLSQALAFERKEMPANANLTFFAATTPALSMAVTPSLPTSTWAKA